MSREKRHDDPPPVKDRQPQAPHRHDVTPPPATAATGQGPDAIEQLQQELGQLKDQQLRLLAECDNTKKRLHREKEEFARYAAETMVRELLPVMDSLGQALIAVDQQADPQAVIKGVHLIHRQLMGLLAREGVKRIPTVGEPFDPHKHEAVAQVAAENGVVDGTVVEEIQVGYTMHDRVIRPAIVKVAKTQVDSAEGGSAAGGSNQQSADRAEQKTLEDRRD